MREIKVKKNSKPTAKVEEPKQPSRIKVWGKKQWDRGCLVCRVFISTMYIIVPGALSAYLIYRFNDTIVLGIGVAFGVFSFARLVATAYKAERKA